jgi:hypothetical protein
MLATAPNPSAQLDEWEAYDRLEPFGQQRGDMQAGIAANMLRAMHNLDPLDPRAYVLDFDETRTREQSPEEIEAKLTLYFQAANARFEETQKQKPH